MRNLSPAFRLSFLALTSFLFGGVGSLIQYDLVEAKSTTNYSYKAVAISPRNPEVLGETAKDDLVPTSDLEATQATQSTSSLTSPMVKTKASESKSEEESKTQTPISTFIEKIANNASSLKDALTQKAAKVVQEAAQRTPALVSDNPNIAAERAARKAAAQRRREERAAELALEEQRAAAQAQQESLNQHQSEPAVQPEAQPEPEPVYEPEPEQVAEEVEESVEESATVAAEEIVVNEEDGE